MRSRLLITAWLLALVTPMFAPASASTASGDYEIARPPKCYSHGAGGTPDFFSPGLIQDGDGYQVACGARLAFGGRAIPLIKPGINLKKSIYGHVKGLTGIVVASVAIVELRDLVVEQNVPWPNPNSKRAKNDKDRYRVYQIFVRSPDIEKQRLYKYGITKQGAVRPQRQLKRCTAVMKVRVCAWRWLRTGPINGWLAARRIEAGYAARYKRDHGKCPPGMVRCL